MASEIKQISLRLPVELHAKIAALADRETRSIHGEIIALLREALAARESKKGA